MGGILSPCLPLSNHDGHFQHLISYKFLNLWSQYRFKKKVHKRIRNLKQNEQSVRKGESQPGSPGKFWFGPCAGGRGREIGSGNALKSAPDSFYICWTSSLCMATHILQSGQRHVPLLVMYEPPVCGKLRNSPSPIQVLKAISEIVHHICKHTNKALLLHVLHSWNTSRGSHTPTEAS